MAHNKAVETLVPRSDISQRTLLARLDERLQGMEDRSTDRFNHLDAQLGLHTATIATVAADLTVTREAVARIEGERTAEHRLRVKAKPPLSYVVKIWVGIVAAAFAGLGSLALIWPAIVRVIAAGWHALNAAPQ
jgi:hypothetical protein